MLTAYQLNNYANDLMELYSAFELTIMLDLAKRIEGLNYNTSTGEFYDIQSRKATALYNKIIVEIGTLLNKSEREVKKILVSASKKSLGYDDKIYKNAGYEPIPISQNPAMLQVLKANIIKTNGQLRNLTMTTALNTQQMFINATNTAHLEIISNTVSYDVAIKKAIKNSAEAGIYVSYPDGVRNTVESAVRRAVLTSVSQTTGVLQIERLEEMGTDLVEVTSHAGSRPDHALWQGKVFSYSGSSFSYPPFIASTGYGTVTGLKGANCKHDFFPFFEGSEPATREKERFVTYNGKKMTEYEGSQIQRKNERNIRKWKRQSESLKVAKIDNSYENGKIKEWQAKQRDLIKQTGLTRDYEREQIG